MPTPILMVVTWLTEFRIDRIRVVLQKGTFCMFKQVRSGWPNAIRSIRNSVNPGPTILMAAKQVPCWDE